MQREIEAAGISTIILSTIPDLTASVSPPRLVGIEYPQARLFGLPHDQPGQLAVLRSTLRTLQEIDTPGGRVDLPFEWPQPSLEVRSNGKQEMPPIATYLVRHPWHLPNLLNRTPPN